MTAGTPESAYPQYADNPALVPGPNSHMPSFFINGPRVLTWGIQLLPTKQPPKMTAKYDGQRGVVYGPPIAVTGPNALNPTPLKGSAAAPAASYASMPLLRAPSLNQTGGTGGTACPTTR